MPPHCDSLDGPVVTAARQALAVGDVELILPFVHEDGEQEVRGAFERIQPVLATGGDAAEVAQRWFFETVVRVHRAGEHAPYTGLKPAGLDVGPAIPLAEKAIESGDPDAIYEFLAVELRHQLAHRLEVVAETAAARDGSVAAARRHVEAVLGFQVYAHRVYRSLVTDPHGEDGAGGHDHG